MNQYTPAEARQWLERHKLGIAQSDDLLTVLEDRIESYDGDLLEAVEAEIEEQREGLEAKAKEQAEHAADAAFEKAHREQREQLAREHAEAMRALRTELDPAKMTVLDLLEYVTLAHTRELAQANAAGRAVAPATIANIPAMPREGYPAAPYTAPPKPSRRKRTRAA